MIFQRTLSRFEYINGDATKNFITDNLVEELDELTEQCVDLQASRSKAVEAILTEKIRWRDIKLRKYSRPI